jgi:hypothetical protein
MAQWYSSDKRPPSYVNLVLVVENECGADSILAPVVLNGAIGYWHQNTFIATSRIKGWAFLSEVLKDVRESLAFLYDAEKVQAP